MLLCTPPQAKYAGFGMVEPRIQLNFDNLSLTLKNKGKVLQGVSGECQGGKGRGNGQLGGKVLSHHPRSALHTSLISPPGDPMLCMMRCRLLPSRQNERCDGTVSAVLLPYIMHLVQASFVLA